MGRVTGGREGRGGGDRVTRQHGWVIPRRNGGIRRRVGDNRRRKFERDRETGGGVGPPGMVHYTCCHYVCVCVLVIGSIQPVGLSGEIKTGQTSSACHYGPVVQVWVLVHIGLC